MLGRTPYGADWYVLGNSPGSYAVANDSDHADGLFTSTYMEAAYTPRLLDYGSSKSLLIPYPLVEMHARFTCDVHKGLDTPVGKWQKAKMANTPAINMITTMMYMGDHAGVWSSLH